MFTSFLMGFIAKTVASLDDTLLRIPIFAVYTKTLKGKIYFSIGTLAATITVLAIALFLSSILKTLPFTQEITIGIIFLLAILIYFEVGLPKAKKKHRKNNNKRLKFFIGFFVAFASLIDDMIVMLPLFISYSKIWIIAGALASTLIGIYIVFYFSKFLQTIKYKKEIASISLAIYGVFLLINKI